MSSDSIYDNNYDYNDDDDIYTFETNSTMIILGIFCFILFTLLCLHAYGLRRRQNTRINHSNHSVQLNSISFNPTIIYTPEICTICLEPFNNEKNITKLSCNHYFHIDCITQWFNENHLTCPFCNNNINDSQYSS